MNRLLDSWPWWGLPLLWTIATIGVAVAIGYVIRALVASRLARAAAATSGQWDDIVVSELQDRVPFWSVLVGAWLAAERWPLGVHSALLVSRVLEAVGIASVTVALASVSSRLLRAHGLRAAGSAPVSGLTQNLVRAIVIVLGALVIVRSFGVDITPYLTALGVGGLAIALAVQEPLSNLFSGIFVSIAGQIHIGDYVRLEGGIEGYINDFNWHSTRIQAPDGNLIIVPNSRLARSIATNFSQPQMDLSFGVELGVAIDSDLARVEAVTVDVARAVMREVPGGVPAFEPSVRFHHVGDFRIGFTASLRARAFADIGLVKHEFLKRALSRYAHEGILVPYPTRTVMVEGAAGGEEHA